MTVTATRIFHYWDFGKHYTLSAAMQLVFVPPKFYRMISLTAPGMYPEGLLMGTPPPDS